MNVLIIPAFFQTKSRPTLGSFFMEQALALKKAGHQVTILYCDTYSLKCVGEYISYAEDSDKCTEEVRIIRERAFCPLKHGMEGHREAFSKGILRLYRQYISDRETIDIIHAHCCVWAGYAAMKLSEQTGIPYLITEHATLFQLHRDEISSKNNEYIKEAFCKASKLVCVSGAFRKLLSDYRDDIEVIGNVVNCDRFHITEKPQKSEITKFLTVCYMVDEAMLRKKGIDILLKAWKLFSAKNPNAVLTIGGGGQGKKKAVEWVKEYGIQDSVVFAGQLSREQVAEQMQQCDCFVLPSRYETFGVVYIEAMACGKPVIAVRNGGPDDFVKDFNGILVEAENVNSLADAMVDIAGNQEKYDPCQIADFVQENFSEQAIARQLEGLYRQILEM